MSEIGDELRKVADEWDVTPLYALADRIDAEMVELPRGKDGSPIHVGDTIYGEDGRAWHVRGVTIGEKSPAHPGHVIRATSDANEWRYLKPEWLSHECPDSWERIADDMRSEIGSLEHGSFASDDALEALRDYEERIRRLARMKARDGQKD